MNNNYINGIKIYNNKVNYDNLIKSKMKDYYNLLKEYQDLKTKFKNKKDNMKIFFYNIQSFELSISSLIKSLNSNSPLEDDSLISFNKLYTDLLVDLKNLNEGKIDIITIPLKQMIKIQNNVKKRIFGLCNDIKNSLFEGKQKLNKIEYCQKWIFKFFKSEQRNTKIK